MYRIGASLGLIVGPVTAWDAADGTVVVSPHVAALLGVEESVLGGAGTSGVSDVKIEVRGVEVREATRVLCRCVLCSVLS